MRTRHSSLALAVLAGCTFVPTVGDWSDQLAPAGPCYEVNLLDGVERGDTAELHALFGCLNRQGTLSPLARADIALDAPTRDGTVATDLFDLGTAAGESAQGLSLGSVLDSALALFDDRAALVEYVELGLELVYAAPVSQLGVTVSLNSATSLDAGLVVPAFDTIGAVTSAILDSQSEALAPLADGLDHADAPRWVWSLALAAEAPDPALSTLASTWPALLADTLALTPNTSNNRHSGPYGDSLRDLVSVALAEDALVAVGGGITPLLQDEFTTGQVSAWVIDEDQAGRLDRLDEGVAYLIAVRADGNSLASGDDSAFVSLIRLLNDGNQSVDCEVDLGITTLEFSLGNLSVSLLTELSKINADSAASGVDVLGDVLGYPLTGALLDAVADSGVCPVIDDQLVGDLESLDRLSDPAADDLLRSLLGFLQAVDEHIPEVVNLAGALHSHQLVEPTEELIRDLAGQDLADALLAALPALVDPDGRQASSSFPGGIRPIDMTAIATLAVALTDADNVEALSPLLTSLVAQSSTWTAISNLRPLLLAGDTRTSHALELVLRLAEADPSLEMLPAAAEQLRNPSVTRPALGLLESTAVRSALTDTELLNEGALPWVGRLYVGGTVDVVLDTLTLVRGLLGAPDA